MIRLRVPGSLTYRHLALRVVAAACKMAEPQRYEEGVDASGDGDFEFQTVSAFGEAFNNVAIHGYRDGPPGDVDIEIQSDEDGIVIRMMDTGASFDPAAISEPHVEELPESGMGLFIIRSFMDEVEYCPGNPNVLRLVKRREASPFTAGGEGPSKADGEEGSSLHTGRGAASAGSSLHTGRGAAPTGSSFHTASRSNELYENR